MMLNSIKDIFSTTIAVQRGKGFHFSEHCVENALQFYANAMRFINKPTQKQIIDVICEAISQEEIPEVSQLMDWDV